MLTVEQLRAALETAEPDAEIRVDISANVYRMLDVPEAEAASSLEVASARLDDDGTLVLATE